MLPQPIDATTDPCQLSQRWGIDQLLAQRLVVMASNTGFGFSIISGLRTAAQQDALRAAGRPTADNDKSTHLSCPAGGADLRPHIAVTRVVQALLGQAATFAQLRWGGGSKIDASTGIPFDWNHVDLGPRT